MSDKLLPIKENGVVITMACSNSYKAIMGVLLESIVENASRQKHYDIVILEYGIPDKEKINIRKHYERDNVSVRFFSVEEKLNKFELYVRDYLSVMTYARLLIPQIFANFKRVLYLDCDMVCTTDVAELFYRDMQGMSLLAVTDAILNMEAWTNPNSEDTRRYLEDIIGITEEGAYVNGGAIVFDITAMNQEENDLLEVAESCKWRWADQDVLNHVYANRILHGEIAWNTIVVANYRQRRRYLERSNLCTFYEKALNEPKIVHYAGEMLPCYRKRVPLEAFFWKYAKNSLYFDELEKRKRKKTSIKREMLDAVACVLPYDGKVRGMIKKFFQKK